MAGVDDETAGLREQIAQLKLEVAALERSDAIHREMVEASPDVIFRFGLDTICTYASPALVDVLGYTREPSRFLLPDGTVEWHPYTRDISTALAAHRPPPMITMLSITPS